MIEFENVKKTFEHNGKVLHALDGVSFEVSKGQIYGIIGQSGAGKSTLIRCAALLDKPSSGKLYVDGIDISSLPTARKPAFLQKIGMIFQSFNLMSQKTAYANVALPLRLAGRTEHLSATVTRLLERVGMSEHAHKYPSQLSGGQKQRIAIARALTLNPSILLCDEATSALDPESTESILALLQSLNKDFGLTILLITHEMDVVKRICHQVAILNEGKLIEQGPVIDVFSKPKNDITKSIVQTALQLKLPKAFKEKVLSKKIGHFDTLFQLTYVGDVTSEPLLSILASQFGVTVNILLANIENINNQILGQILVLLSANEQQLDQAITFLEQSNLMVERIGYVERTST